MHAIVPLADGFEEIEAVTIIDLLRRARIDVAVAGVHGTSATGSHGVAVQCDVLFEDCDFAVADALVLPGGMPGSRVLRESQAVRSAVTRMAERGKIVAAICAAPIVLEACGVLKGRHATSHPDHAYEMRDCRYQEKAVVEDGNIITSRGAGTAIDFAAAVARRLAGD
ncbi:MAG TPA: DJ-1 family glyoxalase III, partial [Candidatus Krumholzibacteria bacterium]|nr:DJ-1 family glyoxalase III [Candidatus Krumholzibacteria bacterium]